MNSKLHNTLVGLEPQPQGDGQIIYDQTKIKVLDISNITYRTVYTVPPADDQDCGVDNPCWVPNNFDQEEEKRPAKKRKTTDDGNLAPPKNMMQKERNPSRKKTPEKQQSKNLIREPGVSPEILFLDSGLTGPILQMESFSFSGPEHKKIRDIFFVSGIYLR